jgi:uncharacterized protein (TIGR01777 family)
MDKKIVIAGGTGFVGNYFAEQFRNSGYEIIIISRQEDHVQWNDRDGIINALENSEMLINLAGKSVDCRYTPKNKYQILKSRTETTQKLGEAILKCKTPPPLWINSSTATIYRHAEDRPMSESSGEIGSGFSVEVAKSWEETFFSFQLSKTRTIALRMAIVLGKNGGVIRPFKNLVRFGLGGIQGNGKQMFSWIHIEDLYNIILFFQTHEKLNGVYNCSAPNPIDNKTLMKTFREIMHVKIGLPSPKWLLTIGAAIIKTETELLLKSRWVVPEKLLNEGFVFKYPNIESALKNILTTK